MEVNIPDRAWEDVGPTEGSRLLAMIYINGCPMHVEAVRVRNGKPREVRLGVPTQEFVDAPGWVMNAIDASGEGAPMRTVKINEHDYVLIATPYQG